MIVTQGIVKRFGRVTAVDRASFAVPAHSVCGFLGPNGAGKTTTIRMLVGALAPDEGRMEVAGHDVASSGPAARASTGYLAEESPLHPELTVEEFVRFRAGLHGVPRRQRAGAVEQALQRCQAWEVRRRLCGQLSKGYRQRTGLAAAIVHQPQVIILDEPTSGLDPAQVLEFRKLLRELADRATVLLSSHVLAEVEAVCDRAVLIHRGAVAAQGTLDELRARGAGGQTLVVETAGAGVGVGSAAGAAAGAGAVSPEVRACLAAVPGVRTVESSLLADGWQQWRVRVAGAEGSAVAAAVSAALAQRGVAMRRLELQAVPLEEVFHRVMQAGGAA
ncbi:MAG: ABC transporter ATP-binding protein [Phycisphaerales bacterium]